MLKISMYKKMLCLILSIFIFSCSIHNVKNEDSANSEKVVSMKYNQEYQDIINGFYTAFKNGNAEEMVKYYHDDIEFEDPAFGKLTGDRAKSMWKMLVDISKGNIKITFNNIQVKGDTGSAEWEAIYNFSKTGRLVHNKVKANFEFKDGKIYRHKDEFDLWAWSRMAFGFMGTMIGFTPFFKNKLNEETNKQLTEYMQKKK